MKRHDRIHDFDPWMNLIYFAWSFGFGCFFLGEKSWLPGIIGLVFGALWMFLFVWGVRRRWKSDLDWHKAQAFDWSNLEKIMKDNTDG